MKVVLTGGGTAGHVMPNLAVAKPLTQMGAELLYIGNQSGQEYLLCQNAGIAFRHCDSIKFDRAHMARNLKIPFVLPKYVRRAKQILTDFGAQAVFSKGGYVALPVAYAAKALKIPVICHESDATLGLANKLCARFAAKVVTSFPSTDAGKNTLFLGNPLREQIFEADSNKIRSMLRIPSYRQILLIVGGSLGAKAVNEAVYAALDTLCARFFVIHLCGKTLVQHNHENYLQLDYVDDIQDYIACADVIVSRAGANMSGEITALNKRVLYIPLDGGSRGDQTANALDLQERSLGVVLAQNELTPQSLVQGIDRALSYPKAKYRYNRDTPRLIAETILDCIQI